jgi:hypothetical protein
MNIIKKISISLLVIQFFSLYMLETDFICKKIECCGQSKSKPAQSCRCASATTQPVLKNIDFCSCPANLNDQIQRSAALIAESESKSTVQTIKAIFNYTGQNRFIDLTRSTEDRQSEILSIEQFTSVDTYLVNCSLLI